MAEQPGTMEMSAHLDDQQSQALVAALNGPAGPVPVRAWRELMSGRWLVFLAQGEQTYCLLPLGFSRPPGVPEGRGPR